MSPVRRSNGLYHHLVCVISTRGIIHPTVLLVVVGDKEQVLPR